MRFRPLEHVSRAAKPILDHSGYAWATSEYLTQGYGYSSEARNPEPEIRPDLEQGSKTALKGLAVYLHTDDETCM